MLWERQQTSLPTMWIVGDADATCPDGKAGCRTKSHPAIQIRAIKSQSLETDTEAHRNVVDNFFYEYT